MGDFELSFVVGLFHAHVENIDGTAKGANGKLSTIVFPGTSGNRVVVVNLLAKGFIPLRPSLIESEHIESIVVTDDSGHSRVVESGASEFLNFLVFSVAIANRESITSGLVENDFAIISCRQNMVAPS